ncbi:MAG TPA: phage tail protein [Vicinamibacterales bacterium]|nr:phage tail protein [Vicinamibacterales bacterium]
MRNQSRFGLAFVASTIAALSVMVSAADGSAAGPRIGEVRVIALAPGNQDVVTQLHQEGWLEANGQILSTTEYPALYRQLGRAWTRAGIPQDRFAIPRLRDATQPVASSSDPYEVLGSGATPTANKVTRRQQIHSTPLSYWIFAGQDGNRDRQ